MQNGESRGAYQQSKHLQSRNRKIWSSKASSETCSRKSETQSQYRKKQKNPGLFLFIRILSVF